MQEISIKENIQKIDVEIGANINQQLNKLIEFRSYLIDESIAKELKEELDKASSMIEDVHTMGNTNIKNFNRLQFEYNSLNLALQKYEIENEIEILSKISSKINKDLIILEEKQKDLQEKQKQLEIQYNKSEEKSNNLVYNLLGFLASFSIVSAAVGAIENVNGTLNIMIVIAFAVFLLLTTLIGLHNFYKSDNKRESKLQDNYFLWKATGIIIVILMILSGINYIKNNKQKIFDYLDKKIESVIEKKVNNIRRELAIVLFLSDTVRHTKQKIYAIIIIIIIRKMD